MTTTLREAHPDDCESIAVLILELAAYEKLEHEAKASGDDLRRNLFGERRHAEAIIAEVDSRVIGFALFYHTFSTFRGQPGMYLEDLFVKPDLRGKGIGKALLARLAALAVERGCGRLEWAVLKWNEPAIGFYWSLGARPMDEWSVYRLDDEALTKLAAFRSEIG